MQLNKRIKMLEEKYTKDQKIDAKKLKAEIAKQYAQQKEELLNKLRELYKLAKDPEQKEEITEKAKELKEKLQEINEKIAEEVNKKIEELKNNSDDTEKDTEAFINENNEKARKIVAIAYRKINEQNEKYEKALTELKEAKESGNKETLLKTIKKFERVYNNQKYEDRKLYRNINTVKSAVLSNSEIEIPEKLEEAYESYVQNRELLKEIHDEIKEAKVAYYKDEIEELEERVAQLENENNIEDAISNYEKVLEKKYDKKAVQRLKELYKKKSDKALKVYINGKRPNFDVEPFIKDGRTLVPIRHVAEALGATVEWDAQTRTANITKGDKIIQLVIDSRLTKVGSKTVEIDVPATIHNGRTVVPLRFVSESFDSNVGWDDETKLITIEEKEDTDVLGEVEEETDLSLEDIELEDEEELDEEEISEELEENTEEVLEDEIVEELEENIEEVLEDEIVEELEENVEEVLENEIVEEEVIQE